MDKYVYSNSQILKNKFNIKQNKELERRERTLISIRLLEIIDGKVRIKRSFNLEHLKKIHKYMFQDIYDWAGKLRNVDIAKGNTLFCKAVNIEDFARDIFTKLEKNDFFSNLSKKELFEKIAILLLDINALHPFREGNGRVQREFIRELVGERGYSLDFTNISKEKMIELSVKDNPTELAKFLLENAKEI